MADQSLQLVPPPSEKWITLQEFLEISGWKYRWFHEQELIGNIRARNTGRNGRNGKPEREFAVSSLPPKVLERYEAEQLALQAVQTPTLFGSAASGPRLVLQDRQQRIAAGRLDLLTPLLEFRDEAHRAKFLRLRRPDGSPIRTQSDMVSLIAANHSVSERKIWRILKAYDAAGEVGLAKKPRKDAGKSKFERDFHDAACLVASVYLGDGFVPGASATEAYRALTEQRELLGIPKADLPSYDTVRRFLLGLPEPLKALAREGRKKFGEQHLPYIRRGYTEPAGDIWLSDHAIADVEVLNDCFFGPGDPAYGAPMRMRLTALLDYRSRMLLEHVWCVEGSSVSLAAAMVRGVRKHGLPSHFYCDNGKDYVKFARGAAPAWLTEDQREEWWSRELDQNAGMLARLGIRVSHCIPHHPQSKHVERFFRTMHTQFCSLWWTYTGGTPSRRPDATTALMMMHRKLIRHGEVHKSMTPPATLFMQLFDAWLEQYHNAPHSGEGMNDRSPAQVFAEERGDIRPAPPLEQLITAGMEHDTRQVRECAIHLFNTRYVPTDDRASAELFRRSAKQVRITYDRLDPEWIAVLDDNGYFVCMLRAEQLIRFAPDDPQTQAQVAASMQQRGMLQRATREQLSAITRASRTIGARMPVELLAAKTLPGPVEEDRITQRPVKPQRLRKLAEESAAAKAPVHAAGIAKNFLRNISEG